jgi:hypothetical protein
VGPSGLVDSDRALRKPAALSPLLELGEQLTHRSSGALTPPARCYPRQDVVRLAPRRPRRHRFHLAYLGPCVPIGRCPRVLCV